MRLFILLFCLLAATRPCDAQPSDAKVNAIKKVIEGYNTHNYALMKEPCDSEFRSVVSDDILKEQFGEVFTKYGSATIDIIHPTFSQQDVYIAKLIMKKHPEERTYWLFNFTGNKIVGFGGEGFPNICYHKRDKIKTINPVTFTTEVNKLLQTKYLKANGASFNGSIAVIDNGKTIYHRNFGYANYFTKQKINDSTIFDLASCTKQFTSIAILMLAEQGKLNVSDNIQKYIPGFPYDNITIHHLITHTSGLPEYMRVMDKVWDKSKMANNYDIIDVMNREKPEIQFNPGERFEYSNFGYAMLSIIIEKVSGKTYADYLQQNIFSPLGMKHTLATDPSGIRKNQIKNYATNYTYSEEQKKYLMFDTITGNERAYYLGNITGEGGVYSCIKDLLLWENELVNPKLLSKELLQQAFSDNKLNDGTNTNYGAGFFLINDEGLEPVVYHTGGWAGYESVLFNFFDKKKQIIILCNNNYDGFTRIADDIDAMMLE